jgi:hypothetical protein
MPSRSCQAGDTVMIRGTVVEAGSDYFQVLIDDGKYLSITAWVPAGECAKPEDVHRLKPIRRTERFLDR